MIRTNSGFTCPDQHEGEKDRNEEAGWGVPDHIYIYNYKQMFWGKKENIFKFGKLYSIFDFTRNQYNLPLSYNF